MDKEEILRRLGLTKGIGREAEVDLLRPAITSVPAKLAKEASKYAVKLDSWDRDKGRDLFSSNAEYSSMGLSVEEVSDFLGMCFLADVATEETCSDRLRFKFVERMLESPEFAISRKSTVCDVVASEMAVMPLASKFASFRSACERAVHRKAGPKRRVEDPGEKKTLSEDDIDEMASVAVAEAAEEVAREVAEYEDAMALAGGCGKSDPIHVTIPLEQTIKIYERIRKSPLLRRIVEGAGRFRNVARSTQRQKTMHGSDDFMGVCLGGEVHRMVDSELSKFGLPELEMDLMRRLVDREVLCRDFRSQQPVGKGPIIFTIDESGSMQGNPVEAAKAMACATAWMARQQKRWCSLVAYSGECEPRSIKLPPGRWNEWALLDWLEKFISGGSNIDIPVRELPELWYRLGAPTGKTDVVMVTDAICRIPEEVIKSFNEWKAKAMAKVIVIIISSRLDRDPSSIAQIADEWHIVPEVSPDSEPVSKVFSI